MQSPEPYMDINYIRPKAENAGWAINWSAWDLLSPYEKSFFALEFSGLRTFSYYLSRLKAIGFTGMESVLDVACGMGQWSMALAELNKTVIGTDINTGRLKFAQDLAATMQKPEAIFSYASMEKMDFPDNSFDGLFCYGSFMFAHMDKTLKEFNRLLKSGGRAYLNANTTGWYLHLFFDRGLKKRNFSMMRSAVFMAGRTIKGETANIIVRRKWLERLIDQSGFNIVASGPEGTVNLNPSQVLPPSAYPPTFYGMPSILEYVIEKR